jgi:hypothetical protein
VGCQVATISTKRCLKCDVQKIYAEEVDILLAELVSRPKEDIVNVIVPLNVQLHATGRPLLRLTERQKKSHEERIITT